jgi:transcriptional regulator of acetoin/glycerol metabolism
VSDVCVASGSQVAAYERWHDDGLRRYWLCAAVCISNERAAVTAVADVSSSSSSSSSRRLRSRVVHVLDDVRRSVAVVLRDDRMLAHDDGEGRPLRYMSLYGGMVTRML